MVEWLATLGHEPVKIRHLDFWYLSPLRDEKTPSFKVNRKINRWYDHGIGKGGTIIDFGMLFYNVSVGDFLKSMKGSLHLFPKYFLPTKTAETTVDKIIIMGIKTLQHPALINYLESRKIPLEIAAKFCNEINFSLYSKNYFAIGFKNDLGGYEIRNAFFKGSSSPKSFTTIQNGNENIAVFEGFFDQLSYLVLASKKPLPDADFLILNSLSFFERAKPIMERYKVATLYLDRDKAGHNCSLKALSISPIYKDGSKLYQGYTDLNQCLQASTSHHAIKPMQHSAPKVVKPESKRLGRKL